jgi:hypothetical protein
MLHNETDWRRAPLVMAYVLSGNRPTFVLVRPAFLNAIHREGAMDTLRNCYQRQKEIFVRKETRKR